MRKGINVIEQRNLESPSAQDDSKICSLALGGRGLGRGGKCHTETLTRISKFTPFIKKFNPQLTHTDSHTSPQLSGSLCITGREGKNNVILSSTSRG